MKHNLSTYPRRALQQTICYVILIVLLVCMASTVTVLHISSSQALQTQNQMQTDFLSSYSESLRMMVQLISEQVNLFLLDNQLWELLYSDTAKTDYLLLRSILTDVKNKSYLSYMDSMYVFDTVHDFVLADGYYRKEKFYDPEVLGWGALESGEITGIRVVNGKRIFSVVYHPMAADMENPVSVVVNLSVDQLAKFIPMDSRIGELFMTNGSGEVLYASSQREAAAELLPQAMAMIETQGVLTVGSEKYVVNKSDLKIPDLTLFIFQDYKTATNARTILLTMVWPTILLVLLACAVLASVIAYRLYYPLGRLVRSVADQGQFSSGQNEYKMIESAFTHLLSSRNEMKKRFDEASQHQEMYALQEFLINPEFHHEDFANVLSALGLSFAAPLHVLFLFDTCDSARPLVLPPDECYEELPQHITSRIHQTKFALLINYAVGQETAVRDLLLRILQWYRENDFEVFYAQSEPFEQIQELFIRANSCEVMLGQNIFWQRKTVPAAQTEALTFQHEEENNIYAAVRKGDKQQAQQAIEQLIAAHEQSFPPAYPELARHSLLSVAVKISQLSVKQSTAAITQDNYLQMLSIMRAKTLYDISQVMCELAFEAIDQNADFAHKRTESLVEQAKRFVADHLQDPLSLEDIAQSVYLSVNYFCTVFKEETGLTVMDYVVKAKIERSCDVIRHHPSILIHQVAEQFGYQNVQKFTRQFKKVMGVTPDVYRRNCLAAAHPSLKDE